MSGQKRYINKGRGHRWCRFPQCCKGHRQARVLCWSQLLLLLPIDAPKHPQLPQLHLPQPGILHSVLHKADMIRLERVCVTVTITMVAHRLVISEPHSTVADEAGCGACMVLQRPFVWKRSPASNAEHRDGLYLVGCARGGGKNLLWPLDSLMQQRCHVDITGKHETHQTLGLRVYHLVTDQ